MPSKKHDDAAKKIAKKYKVDYNLGQGADIQSSRAVVEVETSSTVQDGLRQLQGYRKSVYIAGADKKAIEKALEVTEGTTIGVMDQNGNIIKRSSRKK
jgi:hypothetical protein